MDDFSDLIDKLITQLKSSKDFKEIHIKDTGEITLIVREQKNKEA